MIYCYLVSELTSCRRTKVPEHLRVISSPVSMTYMISFLKVAVWSRVCITTRITTTRVVQCSKCDTMVIIPQWLWATSNTCVVIVALVFGWCISRMIGKTAPRAAPMILKVMVRRVGPMR